MFTLDPLKNTDGVGLVGCRLITSDDHCGYDQRAVEFRQLSFWTRIIGHDKIITSCRSHLPRVFLRSCLPIYRSRDLSFAGDVTL